jgi:hypothetical protein
MSDTILYCLAHKVRANLFVEASRENPDLRRVLGHAYVLDTLITELVGLGYDWNDNTHIEPVTTVADKLAPSAHVQWADQIITDKEAQGSRYFYLKSSGELKTSKDSDDWDDSGGSSGSSDSGESGDSDGSDGSDGSDDSDDSYLTVGSFEKHGNNDIKYEALAGL